MGGYAASNTPIGGAEHQQCTPTRPRTAKQPTTWVDDVSGLSLPGQDECDSYLIAAAGRAMLLAEGWEAAA
jgi:hypothetical protein